MKFRIENISDSIIGIDLSNFWKIIYPNQWGIYRTPERQAINEITLVPDTITHSSEMIDKFMSGKLSTINPGKTLEYFRIWNGSGEKLHLNNNEYLIITVDGQLLLTNGIRVNNITFFDKPEYLRAITFEFPLNEKIVPDDALIIKGE
jgi:hypothetical protein